MNKKISDTALKLISKVAEKTASDWPNNGCLFWTYSPKRPAALDRKLAEKKSEQK